MFTVNAIINEFAKLETNKQRPFPIHLGIEIEENYYIRIVYWQKFKPISYGIYHVLGSLEVFDELANSKKKMIVKHVMNRLKYKFNFDISDKTDRFYVKKVLNLKDFEKQVQELYAVIDQQLGLTDISKPTEFFTK